MPCGSAIILARIQKMEPACAATATGTTAQMQHTRSKRLRRSCNSSLLALWRSPLMERLETLILNNSGVTEAGLEALLELPRPPRLVCLDRTTGSQQLDVGLRTRLVRHFGPGVCLLSYED